MKQYRPRRASVQRWLEDAPEYVLSVHDDPKYRDRYTVCLGGSQWSPKMGRMVTFIGLSDGGNYQWGEINSADRVSMKKIRWNHLPKHIHDLVHRLVTE